MFGGLLGRLRAGRAGGAGAAPTRTFALSDEADQLLFDDSVLSDDNSLAVTDPNTQLQNQQQQQSASSSTPSWAIALIVVGTLIVLILVVVQVQIIMITKKRQALAELV